MSKGTRFRRVKSIGNWRAYNEGLKRRYDVTLWIDEAVLAPPRQVAGKRGRRYRYGDALIEALLTLRCLYRLPLRGTQGFGRSLFSTAGFG